jgi:type II secretory pathway component GspD/PulD (secretin)
LNFLKHRSNSKLLSNPRLTTVENEPATISVQTTFPIQTINRLSEGAVVQDIVTFQDKDIGLSLKVTPRINDDSSVTLHVNTVVEEIIDMVGPTNNQRPETSQRSATTTVVVGNNQTIALGGLLKENRIETEDKVFFLGSIPILGKLFSNKRTQTQTTDLMILITPKIMD